MTVTKRRRRSGFLVLILSSRSTLSFQAVVTRQKIRDWRLGGKRVVSVVAEQRTIHDILTEDLQLSAPSTQLIQLLEGNADLYKNLTEADLSTWLETVGKLPKPFLPAAMERHPTLIARVLTSGRLHSIDSLLENRLGLDKVQIQKLLKRNEPTRQRIRQLGSFLEFTLEFTSAERAKVVMGLPMLLQYNTNRLKEVVGYLMGDVGLSLTSVQAIVKRWPSVLTYSVKGRIQPGIAFLQSLGATRWERLLIKYPQSLTYSVELVLEPRLVYLCKLLDLSSAKQLVTHYPPLLILSQALLETKVEFITQALDLTMEETQMLIETYPQILGLSVEKNLTPKIAFLRQHLTLEELRDFCLYQPALLAYSLDARIKPRIALLQGASIRYAYAPPYLMSMTDTKFQQWLSAQTDSWSINLD